MHRLFSFFGRRSPEEGVRLSFWARHQRFIFASVGLMTVLAVFTTSVTNTSQESGDSPSKVQLEQGGGISGTAQATKQEAIKIVKSMNYPNPDKAPPGKDLRKEYILKELRASVDGTFRSGNFLEDGVAFTHDVNAAKRLTQMLSDPKVNDDTKQKARQALQKIYAADRLITTKALGATDVFGAELPKNGSLLLKRARQELAKGDSKAQKGMATGAIRNYRKAWQYTDQGIDLLWKHFDPDGDDLLPRAEKRLGSDPKKTDTDGDGLTDGQELYETATDPTSPDPESSDRDEDGLTDRREIEAGTDPLKPDTDGEGLDDRFELVEFNSDPTKKDTDADALTDDSEHRLGTNPNNPDTNGNGILDGFEKYTSGESFQNGQVSVATTGIGDVARGVEFQDLSEDKLFQGMPGQMSEAVDITSEKDFEKARVKIKFDPSQVPNGDYQNLEVMYWEETQRTFLPFDKGGVDAQNGYAWAETEHFTTFVLFYIPNWEAVWQKEMGSAAREEGDPNLENLDVMLDLDSSGSMGWNDRSGYRKTAAKRFIDALIEGDRVGVVDFDSYAKLYQPLTQDYEAAKRAVDRVDRRGGTNIARAIQTSNRELINNGDPNHLKVTILLTDGEGYYNNSYTQQAKNADITIYTIGLGYSVDENLLRSIAEGTGGAYYPVSSAQDLPEVFRRIAEGNPEPDDGKDSDGDGLSDYIERGGFRAGNGEFVKTDPNDGDTDDDGLGDGEEAGEISSGIFGDYYPATTDPAEADPDGDGLEDFEEVGIGTDSYLEDTDTDGLSDPVELAENFDPFGDNPDGDELGDAEEYEKGSDPFHADRLGWENFKDTMAGWSNGATGEDLADLGKMDYETISSLGYLEGWIASTLTPVASFFAAIRDADVALTEGDIEGVMINLIGASPLPMDKARVIIDSIGTFNSWHEDMAVALARWSVANPFMEAVSEGFIEDLALKDITLAALAELGWDKELQAAVFQTMPEEDAEEVLKELAEARNVVNDLRGYLMGGSETAEAGSDTYFASNVAIAAQPSSGGSYSVKPVRFSKSGPQWQEIENRVNSRSLWDPSKFSIPGRKAEAYATEAAVQILKDDYTILYVGRNKPLDMKKPYNKGKDAPGKNLNQGPDIVAKDASGKPLIVEVKGSDGKLSLSSNLVRGQAGGQKFTQPSLQWLRGRARPRYLNTMEGAMSPEINEAASLLRRIISQDRAQRIPYDAVWVGYGKGGTTLGLVTDKNGALKQLNPNPKAPAGVNNWYVYTVEAK